MNDGQKRRHIRDIAHLYISGARRREPAPRLRLVIVGEDKRFFPAYHAANLAAGLALRGCEVHACDRSGLLPNIGFYLSLPPSRYIRWDDAPGEADPGLAGVAVDCSTGVVPAAGDSPRSRVDIWHAPPLTGAGWSRGDFPFSRGVPHEPVAVVVVGGESALERVSGGCIERFEPDCVLVFRAIGAGEADVRFGSAADERVPEIGAAAGWETALSDRVPAVLRAPDSALATAYGTAADAIKFKMDELRRTIIGPASAQDPAGLRSGSADRRPDGEGAVLPFPRHGQRHTR